MLTQDEVRKFLGLEPNDDKIDVQAKINAVVDMWESMTGRLWKYRAAYTETFYPDSFTGVLFPRLGPIVGNFTIKEWSQGALEADGIDVPTTEFRRNDGETPSITLTRCTRTWSDNVKLTYDGGYTPVTAPALIKEAMLIQIKFSFKRFQADNMHMLSEGFEKGSTTFIKESYHPMFADMVGAKMRYDC